MSNNLLNVTPDNVYSFICWSADGLTFRELVVTLQKMKNAGIDLTQLTIKIDRLGVALLGEDVIEVLHARFGVRVFYDAKDIEIPEKLEKLAEVHVRHKPYMLNCMAGGISTGIWEVDDPADKKQAAKIDGLKRFAVVCANAGVRSCGVTVLTSKDPKIVEQEFGTTNVEQVLKYARWLRDAGFTDIVCSTAEVAIIRSDSSFDHMRLWVPGIRPAGAAVDDQARVGTPDGALAAGVDVLVIGRPISVGDPVANIQAIAADLINAADAARGWS